MVICQFLIIEIRNSLRDWKEIALRFREEYLISLFFYRPQAFTNTFSKVCIFFVIKNATIDLCPHYCFAAFSTVPTETFENDRIARRDVSWTLWACYKHMRLRYFRSLFSFWCVFDRFRPSTLKRSVLVLVHFQERFLIGAFWMKTLRVLV